MKLIVKNKKAYFDYDIIKTYEAWIELKWYEVKSIRLKQVNLKWSYVVYRNWELFIKSMYIWIWKSIPNKSNIEPDRERKVFLQKKVIDFLGSKLKEKWFSVLPFKLYFKQNLIKMEVWLARWRKKYEKKQILKERTLDMEANKAMKQYL